LSEAWRGERQRADGGDCYHFHGISPRSRRYGAQLMDDWRPRMFQCGTPSTKRAIDSARAGSILRQPVGTGI
jgi:hypothetical protein